MALATQIAGGRATGCSPPVALGQSGVFSEVSAEEAGAGTRTTAGDRVRWDDGTFMLALNRS